MDMLSILVIAGIVLLCLLSVGIGMHRTLDKRAGDLQRTDPETARALRDARRNIDQGKGLYRR